MDFTRTEIRTEMQENRTLGRKKQLVTKPIRTVDFKAKSKVLYLFMKSLNLSDLALASCSDGNEKVTCHRTTHRSTVMYNARIISTHKIIENL